MIQNKPILITGAHRSGTTWVGRVIAESPLVRYIHEPFNINTGRGVCNADFKYWYTYICEENAHLYREHLEKMLRFNYTSSQKVEMALRQIAGLFHGFLKRPAIGNLRSILKSNLDYYRTHGTASKALVKDPIAIFSAEWLYRIFDMDVLILIRHPAAFAFSLKRLNWRFPFQHIVNQPLLMSDHFTEFEDEIRVFVNSEHSVIDQAALLWKLIYSVVSKYQRQYSDWLFIRHEDLAQNPLAGFSQIYSKLGLSLTDDLLERIGTYSKSSNPVLPSSGQNPIRRNSKTIVGSWRNYLRSSEIGQIKNRVEEISREFYSSDDW